MTQYEYKTIPAPASGKGVKGVKNPDARFSEALTKTLDEMAREGWDYIRAETLPVRERRGFLRRRVDTSCTVLIFRRARTAVSAAPAEPASAPPVIQKMRHDPVLNTPQQGGGASVSPAMPILQTPPKGPSVATIGANPPNAPIPPVAAPSLTPQKNTHSPDGADTSAKPHGLTPPDPNKIQTE